jgi:hypothetical protein
MGVTKWVTQACIIPVHFLAQLRERLLCGIGFLSAFLSGAEIGFFRSVFLELTTISSIVRCVRALMLLAKVAVFLAWAFFGTLALLSVPGHFVPFFLLYKAFLSQEVFDFLDLSWLHTRLIALKDKRSEHMSTGVPPFSWRLNWSCHMYGHVQRMWLDRSASAKGMFIGIVVAFMLGL